MTLEQALKSITRNNWSMTNSYRYDVWECPGAVADGVPDWVVYDCGDRGWVSREVGWYYQRADWQGYEDLVHVARAMDATQRTLTDALACLARERSGQGAAKEG